MPINRIDALFQQLRSQGRKAFIPFVTAGDPDLDMTVRLVRELSARGASLIELGIPYSDPIADGPVIQASYTRALERGIKLADVFSAVQSLSLRISDATTPTPVSPLALCPFVAMVSYSIVFRHGPQRFVREAKEAGFDGAIVPDLPVDEAQELAGIATRQDFKLILLVTPTTPRQRAVEIARTSTGFLYYVSVTGITGERLTIPPAVLDQVSWLKAQTDLPICIGFGISQPEHIRMLAPVADGVIVGSAIVRRIAEGSVELREQRVREIGDFVASLIEVL